MDPHHAWNHHNYAVPPERLPLIEACIDALFPWVKFVSKPQLLGYRLADDLHAAALYFRPTPAASALHAAFASARGRDPDLDRALTELGQIDPDYDDHCGFMVPTVAEWEAQVAQAERLQRERPEFQVCLVDVYRPGDGRALTDYLYQAFIRIGLLGPWRNTFEMQARKAGFGVQGSGTGQE
jgi:hypothetical protein